MDTRHLRAAVAVARHRSFTLAAGELFMAQSTVSRQVYALERELGRRLFVRNLRSVDLTPEGRAFLPEAEKILDAVAEALEGARSASRPLDAAAKCPPRPRDRVRQVG
jgi:DNA-binding transcriptional LysR family regulator